MFSILRKIIILTATVTSLAVSFNALAKENTKDSIVVGVITQNDSSNSVVDSVGPFTASTSIISLTSLRFLGST